MAGIVGPFHTDTHVNGAQQGLRGSLPIGGQVLRNGCERSRSLCQPHASLRKVTFYIQKEGAADICKAARLCSYSSFSVVEIRT